MSGHGQRGGSPWSRGRSNNFAGRDNSSTSRGRSNDNRSASPGGFYRDRDRGHFRDDSEGSSFRGRGHHRADSRTSSRGRGNMNSRGSRRSDDFAYESPTKRGDRGSAIPGAVYCDGAPIPPPDQTITALENSLVAKTKGKLFDISGQTHEVPGRRGFGTTGAPIILRTNYFAVKIRTSNSTWYKYDVDIQPELAKAKQRRAVKALLKLPMWNDASCASDYGRTIIATRKLSGDPTELTGTLELPPPGASLQTNQSANAQKSAVQDTALQQIRRRNTVSYKITEKGIYSPESLSTALQKVPEHSFPLDSHADGLALFNLVFCEPANTDQNIAKVGQNRFYPTESHELKETKTLSRCVEAVRGYFLSTRHTVGRILLNINVTGASFFKSMPLTEFLKLASRDLIEQENAMRRLKVIVHYPKTASSDEQQSIRTIHGFARPNGQRDSRGQVLSIKRFGESRDVFFEYQPPSDGSNQIISVSQYYKAVRGINLSYPELPVINCGNDQNPMYIPQELCAIAPSQPYRKPLNPEETTQMLDFAARRPNANAMSIAGTRSNPGAGLKIFGLHTSDQAPSRFGLNVDMDMLTVPGRILKAPMLGYVKRSKITYFQPQFGSWNLIDHQFIQSGNIGRWQTVELNDGRPSPPLTEILNRFENALGRAGIRMERRHRDEYLSLAGRSRQSTEQLLVRMFETAAETKIKLLVVVLPDVNPWLYARIKFYGDVIYGIHTVNVTRRQITKPRADQLFGNLSLKINIKGGGVNHILEANALSPLDSTRTMFVGIDVTHPAPGNNEAAPSIAAVVASTDKDLAQWPGSLRMQKSRVEMVQALGDMIQERLEMWRKKNREYPRSVVVYRDGVSEGQYIAVLRDELPGIQAAFQSCYGDQKLWPKLAILVVGKRHHTRFYPTRTADADTGRTGNGTWNPRPGTVVDRGICGPVIHEFWLQAHQGLQGTARPAHYVVLKDEMELQADDLERITHSLCYMFSRATKSVSLCPPAYYADLLCERGRHYLHEELSGAKGHGETNPQRTWQGTIHPNVREVTWYL